MGVSVDTIMANPVSILLAEDNAVLRELGLLQLKKLGFSALAVSNGHEAAEAAREQRFDLILMDCMMPGTDGFRATELIRRHEKETGGHHVPIVAMTASGFDSDRTRCLACGMDDYLTKPINQGELARVVERWARPPVPGGPPADQPAPRGAPPLPVDLERLRAAYGGEALGEILQAGLSEAGQLLEHLRSAAAAHQVEAVATAAHQLRGVAMSLQVKEVVALLSELDRAAREGDWHSVTRTAGRIEQILAATGSAFEAAGGKL